MEDTFGANALTRAHFHLQAHAHASNQARTCASKRRHIRACRNGRSASALRRMGRSGGTNIEAEALTHSRTNAFPQYVGLTLWYKRSLSRLWDQPMQLKQRIALEGHRAAKHQLACCKHG